MTMEIKDITIQDLINMVWGVLKSEWKLDGSTSSSFTLYHDLLDDDYISIDVFKTPKNKIEVNIVFDYLDFYHHEVKVFGDVDELLSYIKKVNNLSLETIKLELDTAFSNCVHKVLKQVGEEMLKVEKTRKIYRRNYWFSSTTF